MEILLLPNAMQDLRHAKIYFDAQDDELFGHFMDKVGDALERIQRLPRASMRLKQGYRLCQLKTFRKHGILFKVRSNSLSFTALSTFKGVEGFGRIGSSERKSPGQDRTGI